MAFPGLAHVAVTVSDLGRSRPWYESLFGAEAVLDEDTGLFHHVVWVLDDEPCSVSTSSEPSEPMSRSTSFAPASTTSAFGVPAAATLSSGSPGSTTSASPTAGSSTPPTARASRSATPTTTPSSSSLRPAEPEAQRIRAADTTGDAGGLLPREPWKATSPKAKMPPSSATMR